LAETTANQTTAKQSSLALFAAVAGWVVPGLGHLILRRPGRALAVFLCVGGLAITGFLMRGNVFSGHSGDAFDSLGYFADLGSGIFYFIATLVERAGPDVSRAAGDYGTRFIATAGVLNVLAALDAFDIAIGKKN
jgi:TM2 domain-containing membrane protein YozV